MIVYRIELCGNGPYSPNKKVEQLFADLHKRIIDSHDGSIDHPSWINDFGIPTYISLTAKHKAGFESLIQLADWFSGFLQELYLQGFKIVEYDGYDVKITSKQLIFIPGRKRRILKNREFKELLTLEESSYRCI